MACAQVPARDAAVCLALIIDCEGGLGPIHYGSPDDLDVTDFELVERGLGVPLAKRSDVSESTGESTYLALAGWLDHSFFMVETPHRGIRPGDVTPRRHYYGAYSIGNVAPASSPLASGGAATWSGAMVGLLLTDPDISYPDTLVTGAATVSVSHGREIADLVVDVEFSSITDETTGADLGGLRWSGLPLRAGSFGIDPASAEEATVSRHPAQQRDFRTVLRPEPRGGRRPVRQQGDHVGSCRRRPGSCRGLGSLRRETRLGQVSSPGPLLMRDAGSRRDGGSARQCAVDAVMAAVGSGRRPAAGGSGRICRARGPVCGRAAPGGGHGRARWESGSGRRFGDQRGARACQARRNRS